MNLIPGIAARQRLLSCRLPLIIILSRVDILPPDKAKQPVECRRQQRAQKGPDPVDPVVSGKAAVYNVGAQRSRGVEGSTGVVVAC